jgi:HNH endonuclease
MYDEDVAYFHQVDHILSRKHGGSSSLENLAYACAACNQYKGTDVASFDEPTGNVIRLFNPRRDRWIEHFRLVGGRIESLTDVGEVTVRILRLNEEERVAERTALLIAGAYPRNRT